jgi:hypothetical protein
LTNPIIRITQNVILQNNTVSDSAKNGIYFKQTLSCTAVQNYVQQTSNFNGTCINFQDTTGNSAHGNVCIGGKVSNGGLTGGNINLVIDDALSFMVTLPNVSDGNPNKFGQQIAPSSATIIAEESQYEHSKNSAEVMPISLLMIVSLVIFNDGI